MLLYDAKYQYYSFYQFLVIKEKPNDGVKLPTHPFPPPRLGLKNQTINDCIYFQNEFIKILKRYVSMKKKMLYFNKNPLIPERQFCQKLVLISIYQKYKTEHNYLNY